MTMREWAERMTELLDFCSLYYTIQLVRCALVSFAVFAVVFLLRKTLLKNRVFLKGALWSLFVPALFVGKMKFFYENTVGILAFSLWTGLLIHHRWLNWLYFGVMFLYAIRLLGKRRKLHRLAAGMERRQVDGASVFVTELPVTPYTIGVFCPKIIMPQAILEQYSGKELQTILIHEKEHIRSGHLLFYFLWDILRVLLWINPLFAIGTKQFREDMEEICDWATIRKNGAGAYEYGRLLLKTMRLLQAESRDFNLYATFAGDKEYRKIRQRVARIAGYKPYKRSAVFGVFAAALLLVIVSAAGIRAGSYGRNNENDIVIAYGFDGNNVTFSDIGSSNALHRMISWDDRYVYIDRKRFEQYLQEQNASGDIFIVFGGIYKLPGVGGFSYNCCYEPNAEGQTVKMPYDNRENEWQIKLLKLL